MILSITVKEVTFWNGNLIYVINNVSVSFDFKKLLVNPLRFVTDVVLNILPCTADFTLVDRLTAMWIAFKDKLTGFRIDFFKDDFCVDYFVLVYS